jgi:hypothetical protein
MSLDCASDRSSLRVATPITRRAAAASAGGGARPDATVARSALLNASLTATPTAPEDRVRTIPTYVPPKRHASVGAMNETEYAPGDPAPFSGIYELLNVLGFPSKTRIARMEGERLPPAPLGWTWRFVGTETNRPFPTEGEFAVC